MPQSTLQIYSTTYMAERDPCTGALLVGLIVSQKKTTGPVYFIIVMTKFRRDRVKEILMTELINRRQSQTTKLLLHNCPIK